MAELSFDNLKLIKIATPTNLLEEPLPCEPKYKAWSYSLFAISKEFEHLKFAKAFAVNSQYLDSACLRGDLKFDLSGALLTLHLLHLMKI